ncbi:uncharacterized protein LOC105696074 [Orussus abietinus]|uniref:uncharacterized protein LOC105696074 n=1 Tax=Orussus abietinus TaxID=222816 RepID=UPI000C715D79|nr:uncharacterized protein LOC105696074 [Orussus abietinus]
MSVSPTVAEVQSIPSNSEEIMDRFSNLGQIFKDPSVYNYGLDRINYLYPWTVMNLVNGHLNSNEMAEFRNLHQAPMTYRRTVPEVDVSNLKNKDGDIAKSSNPINDKLKADQLFMPNRLPKAVSESNHDPGLETYYQSAYGYPSGDHDKTMQRVSPFYYAKSSNGFYNPYEVYRKYFAALRNAFRTRNFGLPVGNQDYPRKVFRQFYDQGNDGNALRSSLRHPHRRGQENKNPYRKKNILGLDKEEVQQFKNTGSNSRYLYRTGRKNQQRETTFKMKSKKRTDLTHAKFDDYFDSGEISKTMDPLYIEQDTPVDQAVSFGYRSPLYSLNLSKQKADFPLIETDDDSPIPLRPTEFNGDLPSVEEYSIRDDRNLIQPPDNYHPEIKNQNPYMSRGPGSNLIEGDLDYLDNPGNIFIGRKTAIPSSTFEMDQHSKDDESISRKMIEGTNDQDLSLDNLNRPFTKPKIDESKPPATDPTETMMGYTYDMENSNESEDDTLKFLKKVENLEVQRKIDESGNEGRISNKHYSPSNENVYGTNNDQDIYSSEFQSHSKDNSVSTVAQPMVDQDTNYDYTYDYEESASNHHIEQIGSVLKMMLAIMTTITRTKR